MKFLIATFLFLFSQPSLATTLRFFNIAVPINNPEIVQKLSVPSDEELDSRYEYLKPFFVEALINLTFTSVSDLNIRADGIQSFNLSYVTTFRARIENKSQTIVCRVIVNNKLSTINSCSLSKDGYKYVLKYLGADGLMDKVSVSSFWLKPHLPSISPDSQ